AFVIMYVTPAFERAFLKAGASNCTQRTEDFVSGSRTQTCALASFLLLAAVATATRTRPMTATVAPSAIALRETFLTSFLLVLGPVPVGSDLSSPSAGRNPGREFR